MPRGHMQKILKAKGLIDVTKGKVVLNPFVLIDGDKIKEIGPQENLFAFQGQAEILDFSGKYILPGLINSHAHAVMPSDGKPFESIIPLSNEILLLIASNNSHMALMSGVTTIRDCGGRDSIMFELRKAIEMGIIDGPRFFLSGRPLTITGGHCHFFHGEVDGIDGITQAVRKLFKEGADFIKIMATGGGTVGSYPEYAAFSVEEMAAAVQIAHRIGKTVAVHCRGIPGMKNSIEAGVDQMEHASFEQLGKGMIFDPELAEKMAKMSMYVTPTLQIHRDMLDALHLKKEMGSISPVEKKKLDDLARILEKKFICFRGLLEAGIQFTAGNDAGSPSTPFDRFWQELEAMVIGSMSPMEAIIATTKTAAEAMKLYSEIGSLEAGKQADIVVIDDDPTVNITALSKVSLVMKSGKIYFRKQGISTTTLSYS